MSFEWRGRINGYEGGGSLKEAKVFEEKKRI
jgi:hypothetical protein